MGERINAGHAAKRALVAFPGQVAGTTMTGRLLSVGGRKRDARRATIRLASNKVVTRSVDDLRLIPEPPRSLPG